MSLLKRTPLAELHIELGARMVPFAGWEMPVQFSSIIEEHRTVRTMAGLFDVSHMGEIVVEGKESAAFLDYLVTSSIQKLETGKALYSLMCYEDGSVVDDLILYQRDGEDFLLCVNASNLEKDLEWIVGQSVGFNCTVRDASANWAQLALQGPAAMDIATKAFGENIHKLKRFRFWDLPIDGHRAIISRTGYTGEDGIEIYIRPENAENLARQLLKQGSEFGLLPIGLGARDSLRLEAGLPLYGHEISDSIDPLTAGLAWTVHLQKPVPFIGKEALHAVSQTELARKVVFFTVQDKRIAREGTTIVDPLGRAVGKVLSGTQSPILNQPIGSALVETSALSAECDLKAEIRGRQIPLRVLPKSPLRAYREQANP